MADTLVKKGKSSHNIIKKSRATGKYERSDRYEVSV